MSSSPPPCFIVSNPDIAGIGVRSATYIQALLGFIPAISALWDGEVASYELEAVESQSTVILITSFAILISAAVQAQFTTGITVFHANLILHLSWMNNTNTFIYFLLYMQRRSQLGPRQLRKDLLSGWNGFKAWLSSPDPSQQTTEKASERRSRKRNNSVISTGSTESKQRSLLQLIFRVQLSGIIAVAVLGTLHLTMLSGIGLWLWINPLKFGKAENVGICAMNFSTYVLLGKHIRLGAPALRIVSLVLYGIFVVPGFNLVVPLAFFLGLFFVYRSCHGKRSEHKFQPPWMQDKPVPSSERMKFRQRGPLKRSIFFLQTWVNPFLVPTIVGLLLLFAICIVMILDIELTFRANKHLETSIPGAGDSDNEWSFGQVLAVLLLVLPLRELRIFGARRDFTASLQNAVRWDADSDILRDLVRRGADVNARADGSTHPTVLHLAVAKRRDAELTRMLLVYGADTEAKDKLDNTPLHTASSHGDLSIVRVLLAHGAKPNAEGGEYNTALQAASQAGHVEVVQLLLENEAEVNMEGGKYGNAMKAALIRGETAIIELLERYGGTPD
ncbi:hypothetical protein R3P38DRAFT_2608460 [Favolaschia claudopus]|uniref:Uncharacterized protein n=1 Tax=Favolaschia claudopus TaxID=2862362 RepID=A0AAW0CYT3_9AGAR